ncbi:uncharacterized protein [Epargyreus clarus]|uniref:uncharacterized protein isoform X2 n=1 Tax=Epargyreus clarus TaxID=520877 RepID=UPI003C2DC26F
MAPRLSQTRGPVLSKRSHGEVVSHVSALRSLHFASKSKQFRQCIWFLIGGTGKVYEGRGWSTVGIHTYGYNNQSIGIAFIGNFNNQEPTQKALDACRALIQCGVDKERLSAEHKVVYSSQLIRTESPGKKLASKVKSWPDFLEDVTEIKKLSDYKELVKEPEGKQEIIPKSNTDLALTKPSQIDLLSNIRDGIKEIIDNLHKLAIQTLDTTESFARLLTDVASKFFDTFTSSLKQTKDLFASNISKLTGTPGIGKCIDKLQGKANVLYDKTDANTRACADRRIKEIDDMIKNLGKLSNDAIDFSNTAVENTKNCTELNYGIEVNTKYCLNSVTRQTQSATNTYQSQRTVMLNSIKTSLDSLPDALNLCSKKPLSDASTETTKLISSIPSCTTSSVLGGFGNVFG